MMSAHSRKDLLVGITTHTFRVGYLEECPLYAYTHKDGYEGIEKIKLEIPLTSNSYNAHTVKKEIFKASSVYGEYLRWYKLYINNLPDKQKSDRGYIS